MSSAGGRDRWERATASGRALQESLPFTSNLMLWGVLLAVVVALVLRLIFLGERVAHYDEGRVAYWALYTLDTGHFAYRRIIHGPLLQHLDRYLFALFPATDFVMRFPVAIIGSLLPATALLFRKHLNRVEVVAMAFFLALNPVLLYYSRFMRSDVLVAAFMFAALGFLVRYYDTRDHRYLYAVAAFVALGFGSKENAIVYVLTWLGAAALLADQALFRPREYDSGAHLLWAKIVGSYRHLRDDRFRPWRENFDTALNRLERNGDDTGGDGGTTGAVTRALAPLRFLWYGIAISIVGLSIFLFIYAPRGAGVDGLFVPAGEAAANLGLWDAVGNPLRLPELIQITWNRFYSEFMAWFGSASDAGCHKDNIIDGWLCYTGRYMEVMAFDATALTAFAIFGFVAERWGAIKTRNVVLFVAYGGFVSVLGYPLGTDVWGAWLVVHAMVPLSIPAAVGVGVIVRWGREAFDAKDAIGVAIAVIILLASVSLAGFVMVDSVYTNDQSDDNRLVQYAQPAGEMQDVLATMREASAENEGTDVLLYDRGGGNIVASNPYGWRTDDDREYAKKPLCSQWHDILPLPWYFAASDAAVECAVESGAATETIGNGDVPVVITNGEAIEASELGLEEDYVSRTYRLRTTDTPITYWISEEYADRLPPE